MKEQFVTYEIALALKKLGFDEGCLAEYYNNAGHFILNSEYKISKKYIEHCKAPLWQQAIDWFREKYGYSIDIYIYYFRI